MPTRKTLHLPHQDLSRLVVSQQRTADLLDCCVDTVESMVKQGKLVRVRLSERRYGITMASILKVVGGEAA
jgi:hypothetical protein